MVWDITSPAGSDFISLGDDNIRTFKTDLQTSFRGNAAEGTEAIFPGSDTANPVFRYRGLKGTTGARPSFGQYGLYINTTLNTLQRDSGSAWEDVATLIPSGTKMPFYQASPPVGWTAVAVNDKFMRVVTSAGTGGTTGGTVAASTSLSHSHTVDSHTHSVPQLTIEHTDCFTAVSTNTGGVPPQIISARSAGSRMYEAGAGGDNGWELFNRTESGTSGAATPGTNSQLGVFAYADFCVGTKD